MTRQEFIDGVRDIQELMDFINENDIDCNLRDVIYTGDEADDYLDEHLVYMAREYSWTDLRDILREIYLNFDEYYIRDGDNFYEYDDYNFEDDKMAVLDEVDAYYPEIWETEELSDDAEDEESEEEFDTSMDFLRFVSECNEESLRFISNDDDEEDEFDDFVAI